MAVDQFPSECSQFKWSIDFCLLEFRSKPSPRREHDQIYNINGFRFAYVIMDGSILAKCKWVADELTIWRAHNIVSFMNEKYQQIVA